MADIFSENEFTNTGMQNRCHVMNVSYYII